MTRWSIAGGSVSRQFPNRAGGVVCGRERWGAPLEPEGLSLPARICGSLPICSRWAIQRAVPSLPSRAALPRAYFPGRLGEPVYACVEPERPPEAKYARTPMATNPVGHRAAATRPAL